MAHMKIVIDRLKWRIATLTEVLECEKFVDKSGIYVLSESTEEIGSGGNDEGVASGGSGEDEANAGTGTGAA